MAAPIDLSTATSLEQQAYMCGLSLQNLELALPAENRPDNASITFDTETGSVTIEVTLDTTTTIADNKAVIGVNAYLA